MAHDTLPPSGSLVVAPGEIPAIVEAANADGTLDLTLLFSRPVSRMRVPDMAASRVRVIS